MTLKELCSYVGKKVRVKNEQYYTMPCKGEYIVTGISRERIPGGGILSRVLFKKDPESYSGTYIDVNNIIIQEEQTNG